jgi:hypothetical protein
MTVEYVKALKLIATLFKILLLDLQPVHLGRAGLFSPSEIPMILSIAECSVAKKA